MRLVRLAVRGLRSFPDPTEIDFARLGEQGLFAIVGPTGAGKSTILDGVFLALFGKSPRGEASDCVSPGATELSVRLEIRPRQVDSSETRTDLAIERTWRWSKRRDATETEVRGSPRHAPVRVEQRSGGGWVPVDFAGLAPETFVRERVVKVSIADFQQAVVLPQGEFDALLGARPKERRQLVASLFRTEHLGEPLAQVLRRREQDAKTEVERLGEAQREVMVSEDDARAAHERAVAATALAKELAAALERGERFVAAARRARERCAARDEAEAVLEHADAAARAHEADRARAALARRAAIAGPAIDELDAATVSAAEAEAEERAAKFAAHEAASALKAAQKELVDARAERDRDLDGVTERLGKARLALERSRAADEDRREAAARADELTASLRTEAAAAAAAQTAAETLEGRAVEAKSLSAELDVARVGESERATALASVAVAERHVAEERATRVVEQELATAGEAIRAIEADLAAAEERARIAEAASAEAEGERTTLAVDADRAAREIELAARSLDDANRAEAAAALADRLRDGSPCPVCGSREHPGVDHRGPAAWLASAERALDAAKRTAAFMERLKHEAEEHAHASSEELRAATAKVDELAATAATARARRARVEAGQEVPPAVIEAQAARERLSARADLALAAVPEPERTRIGASPLSMNEAEALATRLSARARAADALVVRARVAREREVEAEAQLAARRGVQEEAARSRTAAGALADAAARTAAASAREVERLLVAIQPPGQHDLFARQSWPRDAVGWVRVLEERIGALVRRAEAAEAAFETARGEADKQALAAREAGGRRTESQRALTRARAAASAAIARAGFADADAARSARLDPDALAALEEQLARADATLAEARAVFEARSRDVDVEVDADDAMAAEAALVEVRRAASEAAEEGAAARERDGELARRRARGLELAARIGALAPRLERLARLRHVTQGGLLSELAAERHLHAVTAAATEILRGLSSDRYALVRRADGSFGVVDGAHGGLVRAPGSLSGGETFLVSLALALALSERIQLAGRTRFDFFFLDEGFGSLDGATLELALVALERLRDAGRVIGMISHVPAVEERMPCRLRVVPGRPPGRSRVVLELG